MWLNVTSFTSCTNVFMWIHIYFIANSVNICVVFWLLTDFTLIVCRKHKHLLCFSMHCWFLNKVNIALTQHVCTQSQEMLWTSLLYLKYQFYKSAQIIKSNMNRGDIDLSTYNNNKNYQYLINSLNYNGNLYVLPATLVFINSAFCPQGVFMGFLWFSA
jgi:hypothetical protein